MKKLFAIILLAALVVGGWYFASPWLAMQGLADAAQAGDVEELEARVDFPAVRASVNDQITTAANDRLPDDGLLGQIGNAAAEQIGREVANRALTPERIGSMVASGALVAGLLPERLRGQKINWDVEREGFDHFRGIGTFEDGTPGPTLIFRRDGLSWVMTGFELR